MKKLIIIVGPTGSSKSELSFMLAKQLNLQIIVADAFQVYKEINAGINKPSQEELKEIKHHFVNHISIYDEWNVKEFQQQFNDLVSNSNQDIFIVEGGSNLYIDSIIKNYNFKPIDLSITQYDDWTKEQLFEKMQQLDPIEANKIGLNRKRLLHSIKLIETNKRKKSEMDLENKQPIYKTFMIWKKVSRDVLYEKLNQRTQVMYEKNNWYQEVKNLLTQDKNIENLNSLKAIGYPQIIEAIKTNSEVNLELIKQKNRNYAKRQETWIRNKFNVNYIYENDNQKEELLRKCKEFINEK